MRLVYPGFRICSKICAFPETHFDARVGAREGFVWVRGVRQDPSTGLLRPVTCICKNLSNFASRWTRQESRSSVLNAKRFPRTYGVSRRQQARGFSDSDGDCPSLRVGGGQRIKSRNIESEYMSVSGTKFFTKLNARRKLGGLPSVFSVR